MINFNPVSFFQNIFTDIAPALISALGLVFSLSLSATANAHERMLCFAGDESSLENLQDATFTCYKTSEKKIYKNIFSITKEGWLPLSVGTGLGGGIDCGYADSCYGWHREFHSRISLIFEQPVTLTQ